MSTVSIETIREEDEGPLLVSEPQSPAFRQLAEIAALPAGWDGEDADPPTAYAIARAFYLSDLIRRITEVVGMPGYEPVASMPLSHGGLQIEWESETRRFETEIGPDGAMSILEIRKVKSGDRFQVYEKISLRDAASLIGQALQSE